MGQTGPHTGDPSRRLLSGELHQLCRRAECWEEVSRGPRVGADSARPCRTAGPSAGPRHGHCCSEQTPCQALPAPRLLSPTPPLLSWSRPGPAVLRRVQGGQSRGWCPPRQERVADKLRSKRRPQGLRAAWEEARGARRRVDLAKGGSHGTSVTLTTEAKLHKPR